MKRNSILIIPALNPPSLFEEYCQDLLAHGFTVVVCDDGSRSDIRPLFTRLAALPNCTVLTHSENRGKGAALKTLLRHCLDTYGNQQDFRGIITLDSDGQHTLEDVLRMDAAMPGAEGLILGVRDFNAENVPPKSRFGNKTTRRVFRLLYRRDITDTQTGLRGIPWSLVPMCLDCEGDRFEYETQMLIHVVRQKLPILEIPIATVYYNSNAETHFDPIRDSIKIYYTLFSTFFKYLLSSFSSSLIDLGLFQLFLWAISHTSLPWKIAIATCLARICSSTYNFYVNYRLVFRSRGAAVQKYEKYWCLCLVQMLCSALLVTGFSALLPLPEIVIKAVIDTILFLVNYQIQKRWIFSV